MGVSGQRHAPAALYHRGKDRRYPLDRRLGASAGDRNTVKPNFFDTHINTNPCTPRSAKWSLPSLTFQCRSVQCVEFHLHVPCTSHRWPHAHGNFTFTLTHNCTQDFVPQFEHKLHLIKEWTRNYVRSIMLRILKRLCSILCTIYLSYFIIFFNPSNSA